MAADKKTFEVYASTGESLMARTVFADAIKYRADVTSIAYSVQSMEFDSDELDWVSDGTSPVTGSLTVNTVMFTALQTPWVDATGYTFKWDAPGTLWPTADIAYEVTVSFVVSSITYRLKWLAITK